MSKISGFAPGLAGAAKNLQMTPVADEGEGGGGGGSGRSWN